MIRNPNAYARQSEQERWDILRGMSVNDSIAIGADADAIIFVTPPRG